jgi:hypothetical protein
MRELTGNYIKWTEEEWKAIAKRAAALKKAQPEMSWFQIILLSQDDIPIERRRSQVNKMSLFKPLFEILGLDEGGNPKPPPPPPPPPPVPTLPVTTISVSEPSKAAPALAEVVTSDLLSEIFRRSAQIKADIERFNTAAAMLNTAEQRVTTVLDQNTAKLAEVLQRIDVVEKRVNEQEAIVLRVDEAYTSLNDDYLVTRRKQDSLVRHLVGRGIIMDPDQAPSAILSPVPDPAPPTPEPAKVASPPVRFVLVGPHKKDLELIRQKLPRHLEVELMCGKSLGGISMATLPSRVDFCLVTGKSEYTLQWRVCREKYGHDCVARLENGSISTFAHRVEELARMKLAKPDLTGTIHLS